MYSMLIMCLWRTHEERKNNEVLTHHLAAIYVNISGITLDGNHELSQNTDFMSKSVHKLKLVFP